MRLPILVYWSREPLWVEFPWWDVRAWINALRIRRLGKAGRIHAPSEPWMGIYGEVEEAR